MAAKYVVFQKKKTKTWEKLWEKTNWCWNISFYWEKHSLAYILLHTWTVKQLAEISRILTRSGREEGKYCRLIHNPPRTTTKSYISTWYLWYLCIIVSTGWLTDWLISTFWVVQFILINMTGNQSYSSTRCVFTIFGNPASKQSCFPIMKPYR